MSQGNGQIMFCRYEASHERHCFAIFAFVPVLMIATTSSLRDDRVLIFRTKGHPRSLRQRRSVAALWQRCEVKIQCILRPLILEYYIKGIPIPEGTTAPVPRGVGCEVISGFARW